MDGTNTDIDATAIVTEYFDEQLAEARAEAEKANAKLAEAEQEAAAFAERQELPPAVGAMKQGWDVASWVSDRATRIAKDAIDGKATREQYGQAKEERAAVFAWLEANGYEVPAPFKS